MRIYFGVLTRLIDVTEICYTRLRNNHLITIPFWNGNRESYFSDPAYGMKKNIFIDDGENIFIFNETKQIVIDMLNQTLTATDESEQMNRHKEIPERLAEIHSRLRLIHGKMEDELPEQKMSIRYLTGDEKVLEIGGNVGRNSLVISSILKDSANLVTLECDANYAKQLRENRDANNFQFHVEESALSLRKLIQFGIDTIPSETLLPGYKWVNTITFDELKQKYGMEFDTLVLDCEGAFYYILMDMPEILSNIRLIIMENDYNDMNKKNYVDNVLKQYGFYREYVETKYWGHKMTCDDCFFEVWKK